MDREPLFLEKIEVTKQLKATMFLVDILDQKEKAVKI